MTAEGSGAKDDPWRLRTPPGTSEYTIHRDESLAPPALVCRVGTTTLSYRLRCLEDLHAMLSEHGDWMVLGSADESKPAADGTVEAWARSESNPVGGWYGLKKSATAALRRQRSAVEGLGQPADDLERVTVFSDAFGRASAGVQDGRMAAAPELAADGRQ